MRSFVCLCALFFSVDGSSVHSPPAVFFFLYINIYTIKINVPPPLIISHRLVVLFMNRVTFSALCLLRLPLTNTFSRGRGEWGGGVVCWPFHSG